MGNHFQSLLERTAVSGYEWTGRALLEEALEGSHRLQTDPCGNCWVQLGDPSARPDWIVAAALDEPGFVVSHIREDGYLRLQSVHRSYTSPLWLHWHQGRKVDVWTRTRGRLTGAVLAPSVHLRRGSDRSASRPAGLEDLYVDIGASCPEEVAEGGVRLLDSVAARKTVVPLAGRQVSGPGIGTRWGASLLLDLALHLPPGTSVPPTVLLWLAQDAFGRQGIDRAVHRFPSSARWLLLGTPPFEAPVEPLVPDVPLADLDLSHPIRWEDPERHAPGSFSGCESWSKRTLPSDRVRRAVYTNGPTWHAPPLRWGIEVAYPHSLTEVIDLDAVEAVRSVLAEHLAPGSLSRFDRLAVQLVEADPTGTGEDTHSDTLHVLQPLVRAEGVAGDESRIAETIASLLPSALSSQLQTDAEGNLLLSLEGASSGPHIHFVAHMDEIGFRVGDRDENGRLRLEPRGGFLAHMFESHPVRIHSGDGSCIGIVPPRRDYLDPREMDGDRSELRLEPAARNLSDGFVQPLKHWDRLGPHRAATRSFDDRVGCTALVLALQALDLSRLRGSVTFAWSVREEVGLEGAKFLAASVEPPEFVFAVDTFVSADTPLESPRFALAPLGNGAVLRAADHSSITPPEIRDAILAMGKRLGLRLQYGITGGGNDGAVYTHRGSVDVPISWPMRNAHSLAEVIDLRDLEALRDLILALATEHWLPKS